VSESHGRCLLQLWSEERNLCARLWKCRSGRNASPDDAADGRSKGAGAGLVPTSDRRTPTTRDAARRNYQRLLERVLKRKFLDAKVDGFGRRMDLEHSFGPAYVRGRLLRGTAADAVIGVSEAESAAMVDGILTLGILWLDHCRQMATAGGTLGAQGDCAGGAWRTTAERMAWLNHAAADFQLFTLDERSEELEAVDFRDTGNLESRLVHAFSSAAAVERVRVESPRLMGLVPPARGRGWRYGLIAYEVGCCCMGSSLRGCGMGLRRTRLPEDEVRLGRCE